MSGMPPKADLFRQNVWIAPNIGLFSPPMKTGILCQLWKSCLLRKKAEIAPRRKCHARLESGSFTTETHRRWRGSS